MSAARPSDLVVLVLHWISEHAGNATPENAARDLGIDVAVAERVFRELEAAGFIAGR